uniref:Candidate secreted effector n=1 Tax=Meloidogyne incognita TaxID=6306 RepID=A0A914LXF5_MELIC
MILECHSTLDRPSLEICPIVKPTSKAHSFMLRTHSFLKPSCCPFAIPTGAVITLIIASIVLVAVLVGFSCWCCYFCPLYKQLYENEDDEIGQEQPIYSTQQRQQQQQFEE